MLPMRTLLTLLGSLLLLRFARRTVRPAMLDAATTGNATETLLLAVFGWRLWNGVFLSRLGAFLAIANGFRC